MLAAVLVLPAKTHSTPRHHHHRSRSHANEDHTNFAEASSLMPSNSHGNSLQPRHKRKALSVDAFHVDQLKRRHNECQPTAGRRHPRTLSATLPVDLQHTRQAWSGTGDWLPPPGHSVARRAANNQRAPVLVRKQRLLQTIPNEFEEHALCLTLPENTQHSTLFCPDQHGSLLSAAAVAAAGGLEVSTCHHDSNDKPTAGADSAHNGRLDGMFLQQRSGAAQVRTLLLCLLLLAYLTPKTNKQTSSY